MPNRRSRPYGRIASESVSATSPAPASAPVNLHSDTQTRPTAEMRAAMATAEVGDEQRRLDPTTNTLQARVAELLGQEADTAWLDFTKGLGAPVGAVLAGSAELIEEAWRWKQMLGGAMRQSGILAAGCLYALDHHVERLADDHRLAQRLSRGLAELPGVEIDPKTVQTNIVVFTVPDAPVLVARLADEVDLTAIDGRRIRVVTHMDVDADGVDRALDAIAGAL
jgi:threonine aldolase